MGITSNMFRIALSSAYLLSSLLINFLLCSAASAEQLTIAVASNFIAPIKKLSAEFEKNSQHTVKLVFGSSGRFFAQINHGAPFDLFLSADSDKPQRLIDSGLALPTSAFTYANGRLVLWKAESKQTINVETLSIANFDRLAIANAKLAPYGKAAKEVLVKLDLEKATRSKWVVGENISQTYQFVASKNAEYGFIAASQWQGKWQGKKQGSGWLVPENLHEPIRQDGVILSRAKDKKAVAEFVEYLKSPAALTIIRSYGYQ